ncbi:MAG: ABC transporter ATP-binding protein [Nitrospinaceae bacterium]|jgi:branched-chain amino acid transport system ATP-binding protein|nr:ABC transporter ATP-binding protein [Nitrospinaceae bacterium]MBT3434652.1 ABC transporter ATP-binding protein [Nitrospinaceae bacterium]MBT3820058.1 ABC transporter ATP-binding protein [Nitrospinaceae bacterium]MBT4094040.1 ABC transporter ATP-binding protein [Nitrospinaceae bacterium]MBT4432590.1 ABC transporter ATP-binding protein [Nitrospinaceae bacterium]
MLEVDDIHFYYGQIHALQGVSFEVRPGKVACLIGSNGAGKSTTLMSISAVNPVSRGAIRFEGEPIHALKPEHIVQRGICQVPEGRRIFQTLSVLENLEMGAFLRNDAEEVSRDLDHVYSLFPILFERRRQRGGTLSGGEQQMLAIGRALMARPRLLLLDEPSLGLAPKIVETIFEVLGKIREEGTGIFLVEQNAHIALGFADWGYVMEGGRIVMSDRPEVLRNSPEVREAYLGE